MHVHVSFACNISSIAVISIQAIGLTNLELIDYQRFAADIYLNDNCSEMETTKFAFGDDW
jgi:hypothetical protein